MLLQKRYFAATKEIGGIFHTVASRLFSGSPRAFALCASLLAVWVVALGVLIISTGPVVQNSFGHDTPLFLDGAWKILCGQKPHHDWYSPLGAFNFLVIAGAMRFTGATAQSLPMAQVIVLVLVVLVTWLLASPRFPAGFAALYAAFAGIVAVTPHFLRLDFDATTYATLYNRWGYGFLIALLAASFLSPRSEWTEGAARRDALIIGAVVGMLLFIKVTYFMAATLLLAGGYLAGQRFTRTFFVFCATGVAFALLVFGFFIAFDFGQMIGDLRIAAGARVGGLSFALLEEISRLIFPFTFALALCAVELATWNETPGVSRRRLLALLFAVNAVAVFVLATNAQDGKGLEAPLLVAAAFFYVFWIMQTPLTAHNSAGHRIPRIWLYLGCAGLVLLMSGSVLRDTSSFLFAASDKALVKSEGAARFESRSLAPLFVRDYGGREPISLPYVKKFAPYFPVAPTRLEKPPLYVEKINDGLRLLRVNCAPDTTVQSLDFTNPLPFALGWRPAPGSPVSWHAGFSLGPKSFPAAARVFGGSDVLMVPKYPEDPFTTELLLSTYYAYIRQHYRLKQQSDNWFLLVRKKNP